LTGRDNEIEKARRTIKNDSVVARKSSTANRILIYEPAVAGHHLTLLRCVLEDLTGAGLFVCAALSHRPEDQERIRAKLGPVLDSVQVCAAAPSRPLVRAAELVAETGAGQVFFPNLDEFASAMLRRAALGLLPPAILRGKLNGIYVRPRCLLGFQLAPKEWIKAIGLSRMLKAGWFHRIFLQDELLVARAPRGLRPHFVHVPEPFSGSFPSSLSEARSRLGVPADRLVLLHYGVASRRKGLHLTLRALLALPPGRRPFLLCAGPQSDDAELNSGLARLVAAGDALVLNRFILDAEEADLFSASDVILLTYQGHFGISAIQVRAAAAGRVIIASNEEMVGRHTREYQLGWLFSAGDVDALREIFARLPLTGPLDQTPWREGQRRYTQIFSRENFRRTLLDAYAPNA
jgi:glycosyltransferase involved in cell wall biosynthesis